MRNFYAGIVFTVGMYMFGKGMYEISKLDERRRLVKELRKACDEVKNQIEKDQNKEEA